MMMTYNIGWDIGGAHLKAAIANQTGEITAVFQHACPLWRGLEHLQAAALLISQNVPKGHYRHAITMTGELVDLFDNREQGVAQIIAVMRNLLPNAELLIFVGEAGLLPVAEITPHHYFAIASANWLASATFVAQKVGAGLFVDIGSTTTDILLIKNSKVQARGYSDYQRLISQELVYTGIVRTAVMAVAQFAWDGGQEVGLMAEHFATMADVYRVTGELNEAYDQTDTADGGEKSLIASARRLSRMLGCDFYTDELPRWQAFARNIRLQQIQKIQCACVRVINRQLSLDTPIIGAGVGRFLAKEIAESLLLPYVDFAELFVSSSKNPMDPADCAPAVALAWMAGNLPAS